MPCPAGSKNGSAQRRSQSQARAAQPPPGTVATSTFFRESKNEISREVLESEPGFECRPPTEFQLSPTQSKAGPNRPRPLGRLSYATLSHRSGR